VDGCNGRASITGNYKLLRCPTPASAADRPLSERTCRTHRPAPWDRRPWAVRRLRGELRGNGGRNSARSTLRSRALASVGYRAEHAALAWYFALVVNEHHGGSAAPPQTFAFADVQRTDLRGSSLRTTPDFSILAASRQLHCRDAVKIDHHHAVQIEQMSPLGGRVQSWAAVAACLRMSGGKEVCRVAACAGAVYPAGEPFGVAVGELVE